jgi:hypothetical protein
MCKHDKLIGLESCELFVFCILNVDSRDESYLEELMRRLRDWKALIRP